MSRKEEVTALGAKRLEELYPKTGNGEAFKRMADAMSETEFRELMEAYRDGRLSPVATIPNFSPHIVTVSHLKKVAKAWGISIFNHMRLTDTDTGQEYVTPHPYMMLRLQIGRLAQLQEVKRNIPDSTRVIDELTGQVTGASKGAAMSMPETANIIARNRMAFIHEVDVVRGGDAKALRQLEFDIATTGTGSLQRAMAAGGGAKAPKTMAAYIRQAQFDTNLDKMER
jgi:hypothetical protein